MENDLEGWVGGGNFSWGDGEALQGVTGRLVRMPGPAERVSACGTEEGQWGWSQCRGQMPVQGLGGGVGGRSLTTEGCVSQDKVFPILRFKVKTKTQSSTYFCLML